MNTKTRNQIKEFIGSDTWNIVCSCNRAHKETSFRINLDRYLTLLDEYEIDFGDTAMLNKFNHHFLNHEVGRWG